MKTNESAVEECRRALEACPHDHGTVQAMCRVCLGYGGIFAFDISAIMWRVQQIVARYAAEVGLPERIHPHLLRHQMLTWLTAHGLQDAQIQLISGHASKKSLEVYQHLSLADVEEGYQKAARALEI
jgi:integrase